MSHIANMDNHIKINKRSEGDFEIVFSGSLDSKSTAGIWTKIEKFLDKNKLQHLAVNAENVEYCDGAGLSMLFNLGLHSQKEGFEFEINGLDEKFLSLLEHYDTDKFLKTRAEKRKQIFLPEEVGKATCNVLSDVCGQVEFVGKLSAVLWKMLFQPSIIRWKQFYIVAERSGVNALGIICLVGLLFGLILAFTGVVTLEKFGAEIYVANMASLSIIRVLGPFITAVMLSGRSGSAFAAELGSMKINEELDALTTMGIDPIRFLVVPRVLATTLMTPLLAVVANLAGLIGSAVVLMGLGIPLVTYIDRVKNSIDLTDIYSGLFKAFVFGIIIGAVGCLRGMETKSGSSAVGDAATQAVVSSIILIIIAEGVFAVLYYHLGI